MPKTSFERCAERLGTGMVLWQHEYYYVIEKYNGGQPKPYVYQALEFRKGGELPAIEQEKMSKKQRRETWVLGVAYAAALDVRKQSKREKGCLFRRTTKTGKETEGFFRLERLMREENGHQVKHGYCVQYELL